MKKNIIFILTFTAIVLSACTTTTVWNPNSVGEEQLVVLNQMLGIKIASIDGQEVDIPQTSGLAIGPAEIYIEPGIHVFGVSFQGSSGYTNPVKIKYNFESGKSYAIDYYQNGNSIYLYFMPYTSLGDYQSYYMKRNSDEGYERRSEYIKDNYYLHLTYVDQFVNKKLLGTADSKGKIYQFHSDGTLEINDEGILYTGTWKETGNLDFPYVIEWSSKTEDNGYLVAFLKEEETVTIRGFWTLTDELKRINETFIIEK